MSGGAGTPPSALVFTDLVGFTEYTAVRGDDEAAALLAVQDELVDGALPPGARIVKELGDGLFLSLPDAADALAMCLRLCDAFDAAERAGRMPVWVRIGAHWGRPTRRGDDLIGHAVNVAARVVDVAGPGEVVCSHALVEEASPGPSVALYGLGPVVMKGLPEPVALYRVEAIGDHAVR